MVLYLVLGLEGGNSRNGVEPVKDAVEGDQIIRGVMHTDGGDSSPSEERGCGEWDAREKKTLKREYDGRVLDLDPFELKRRPNTDEEIRLSTEEGKGDGGRREAEGGGEEEGNLSEEEGKPDGEEGTRLEVEGIEDVGDHETEC